ncbi:phosphotransferase family protein [Alkalihalobacillus sp. AL-G]|uniref:phosphotransferase family protein n=1 Tax=Alkalihalobacillus sp. AL-G TaxID=2926399 RepID=UPI00272B8E4B|nr:phosphotransferase family protein [Alkalihalobacillus sp. AL-G]WLD92424.1 phosphotransferase family protein [Alkalihalobacillus sp. AL-G]
MKHILGSGWQVKPAGGATGEAYIAQFGEEKIFLKRNSSPFLAVLSAEGIVPKLLWTKRLENGDVITAQHWLDGRELKAAEMSRDLVAKLLSKIHRSQELVSMMHRLGKHPVTPAEVVTKLEDKLDKNDKFRNEIQPFLHFLNTNVQNVHTDNYVVCHGDVNHNNWLLNDEEHLFLIDWDGAVIADPALDLAMLLYWYIPNHEWEQWLHSYGIQLTKPLQVRMHWYIVAQTIDSVFWHMDRGQIEQADYWVDYLSHLDQYIYH